MDVDVIDGTIAAWQADPSKARSRPIVVAVNAGGQAALSAGNFRWRLDLPTALGGENNAPSPTAALLGALAGCAVAFIRDTLAPQLGVTIERLQATAACEADARGLLGVDGASAALENLQLAIEIASPDSPEKIDRLTSVWKARCPIYLALTGPTAVTVIVSRT